MSIFIWAVTSLMKPHLIEVHTRNSSIQSNQMIKISVSSHLRVPVSYHKLNLGGATPATWGEQQGLICFPSLFLFCSTGDKKLGNCPLSDELLL
jgi:hypothetical protein